MLQQISDAELEIMRVVWAKNKEPLLFAELTDELAAKGRPWQKNLTPCTRPVDSYHRNAVWWRWTPPPPLPAP